MSDDQTVTTEVEANEGRTEKSVLMDRARLLGITFSNAASVETLREKINAKLAENPQPEDKPQEAAPAEPVVVNSTGPVDPAPASQETVPKAPEPVPEAVQRSAEVAAIKAEIAAEPVPEPVVETPVAPKKISLRQYMINEQMKLVRLRITNLDPKKKDLQGEIMTVANEHLGTVRKFIPFGEVTEEGYHVPYCLYQMMKERRFQNIRTIKGRDGQLRTETNWAPEFALEVLDPLTPQELRDLATAQAAAGSVG